MRKWHSEGPVSILALHWAFENIYTGDTMDTMVTAELGTNGCESEQLRGNRTNTQDWAELPTGQKPRMSAVFPTFFCTTLR